MKKTILTILYVYILLIPVMAEISIVSMTPDLISNILVEI